MKAETLCAALGLVACLAPAARAAGEPGARHYLGMAYSRDGKLLYREEHWITRDSGGERRVVLYRCPDGKPFARKRMRGGIDDDAPDFDFEDRRDGYREGVTGRGGQRQVYVQPNRSAPRQAARIETPRDAVIDAGFDAYLRNRWEELGAGKDTHIAFLVPSSMRYLNLKIQARDGSDDAQAVRRFRLNLDAWYGFAAPSIDVIYSRSERRLLRFEGIGNIRDDQGQTQQVRIEFPADRQYLPPSAQQVENAETEPLVSRCDEN